jgi:hypothetical protein
MKRPPKMRTPDHTRLNLGQEKYYRSFIEGYIKILQSNLKLVRHIGHNYQYKTYTCGEPHDRRNPNWKPFRHLWDYFERTGYDFMWSGISSLSASVVNWYVNARCFGMMKSAGEWSWRVYLGWILANPGEGRWAWFSLLFGLWRGPSAIQKASFVSV